MNVIQDEEFMHRRIHPNHMKDGRPSSAAFTDSEMSVDRAALRSLDETLRRHEGYGAAAFSAGFARTLDQEVVPDPSLLNKAHALVKGRKNRAISKRFALECSLVRVPQTSVASAGAHMTPHATNTGIDMDV